MPDAELTDRDGELPPNGHRLDTGRSSLLPHREAHNEAGGTGTPGTVLDTTTAADSGLLRVAEDDDDGDDRTPRRNGGSRWNAGKDLSFVPLRPERVVEVRYGHMEGERFRHTAQFNRWRPDRDPHSCTYAQLEQPLTFNLADIVPGLVLGDA